MQNTILQTAKYCFQGFNQFLICETKAQAKAYLKQNSSINRIKDLVLITGELRATMLKDFAERIHVVYDISSGYAIPLENDMRSNEEISDALWDDCNPENCDRCANQESIAAPGETTKCREHQEKSDKQHYKEMAKFFDENVMDMAFSPYLPFCSRCGKAKPDYIGMMKFVTFAFCVACRDALVQLQIQQTQSAERFGV